MAPDLRSNLDNGVIVGFLCKVVLRIREVPIGGYWFIVEHEENGGGHRIANGIRFIYRKGKVPVSYAVGRWCFVSEAWVSANGHGVAFARDRYTFGAIEWSVDFDAKVEVLACNELCPAFVLVKWCYMLLLALLGAFPSMCEASTY